jgi:hypothetical protein
MPTLTASGESFLQEIESLYVFQMLAAKTRNPSCPSPTLAWYVVITAYSIRYVLQAIVQYNVDV